MLIIFVGNLLMQVGHLDIFDFVWYICDREDQMTKLGRVALSYRNSEEDEDMCNRKSILLY